MKQQQVEALLNYQIEPMEFPDQLGTTKGMVENPLVKIELTNAGRFCVTNFGSFLEVNRKGKVPATSQVAT
jgi:hypothetical protein